MTNRQNRSHSRPPLSSPCTTNLIADYNRKVKESRMQAMHRRRMEGNSVQHVLAACIYLRMPFHRGGGNGGAVTNQGRQGFYQVTAGHGGAAARQGISA